MTTFDRFQPEDIVEANQTIVTTGLWSGDDGILEEDEVFLNETQLAASGEYYFDVFNIDPNPPAEDADLAEVQFAISYGHVDGAGAPTIQIEPQSKLPTKVIYSQYKNLLLQPGDAKFLFDGEPSDDIYVINFQRARVREQLDPGNWQLPLSGANGVLTFIDNSETTLGALARNSQAGRIFEVIRGTIVDGPYTGSEEDPVLTGLGLAYPDLGIIILNPSKIAEVLGWEAPGETLYYTSENITALNDSPIGPFAPMTASLNNLDWGDAISAYNHAALYVSLHQALVAEEEFQARSAETISSTHYFVRLRNRDFNYSNNPTFSNAEDGTLTQPEFRENPTVFVTSIGMYNDNNELLAVAKLSKPVRKSFAEELLLRVRLDF